jgi:hypothetical protein
MSGSGIPREGGRIEGIIVGAAPSKEGAGTEIAERGRFGASGVDMRRTRFRTTTIPDPSTGNISVMDDQIKHLANILECSR